MLVQDRKIGPVMGRSPTWRQLMHAALAIAAIGAGPPAFGQGSSLYDETRVLQHGNRECALATHCTTINGGERTLDAGQDENMTFRCPTRAPHFVGWDTEQSEHIQATLALSPSDGDRPEVTGRHRRVQILVQNVGAGPGKITVFLGCSTEGAPPTGMMEQSLSVPSKAPGFRKGN